MRILIALSVVLSLTTGCSNIDRLIYAGWDRDSWQQPDRVLRELGLREGDRVADLGAGGGYFTFRLAGTVGRTGRVYAVDVDQGMVAYLAAAAAKQGISQVETVLAAYDNPRLPEDGVDLIFVCDTYHHLAERTAYFERAARYLRPGGRVAVIDYNGNGWFAKHFGHYTPRDVILQEMQSAGYRLERSYDFIDRQSFLVFGRLVK